MSIFICTDCGDEIDSDEQDVFLSDGEDLCENCWEERREHED